MQFVALNRRQGPVMPTQAKRGTDCFFSDCGGRIRVRRASIGGDDPFLRARHSGHWPRNGDGCDGEPPLHLRPKTIGACELDTLFQGCEID